MNFYDYEKQTNQLKASVECAGCGKISEQVLGIPEGWSFVWDQGKVQQLSGGTYLQRLEYCPDCTQLIEALE